MKLLLLLLLTIMPIRFIFFLGLFTMLAGCRDSGKPEQDWTLLPPDTDTSDFPLLQERMNLIRGSLDAEIPVLRMPASNENQKLAEDLALANPSFARYFFDTVNRKPLRNEIFQVSLGRPQELPQGVAASDAYKVELYNFAYNLTTTAWVDIRQKKVLKVYSLPQSQPDIPPHLRDLAIKIAVRHPEVQQALGYRPGEEAALMAGTKTALNRTRCERSKHLCAAPTFTKGERALWVIVDLTEHRVAGLRWTNTGKANAAAPPISEKRLRYDRIMDCYCKTEQRLERGGWTLRYVITGSDGLRIADVRFKDQPVLQSAKIVDWHVSYSNTEGFGYSDAVGCPEFSSAAVVAVTEPEIRELTHLGRKVGFTLEQRFSSELWPLPCNYTYLQRFEFYTDGRFRVAGASLGRGCGNNGTYRPVFRIVPAGEGWQFAQHSSDGWKNWDTEQWSLQSERDHFTPEGYLYRLTKSGVGYYIEPNRGQFNDGSRGDFAYLYLVARHPERDEGENDLVSIGPCCNTDYHQGPEKFIEPSPEPLTNGSLVIWYVPQLRNDDTPGREYCWASNYLEDGVYHARVYPCMAGPMFIPFKP